MPIEATKSSKASAAQASASTLPKYFKTAEAFRRWLERHASTAEELVVGFHKVDSGRASMSWSESVDEALCHGWIDGVRKRIDDAAYLIRFTPRKRTSIWSAVNIAKFERLASQGRMTAAGAKAFEHRREDKSRVYSHEQQKVATLTHQELRAFKRDKAAWAFFDNTPPSYKKSLLHWITTAKKADTRASRLSKLVSACAAGVRLR